MIDQKVGSVMKIVRAILMLFVVASVSYLAFVGFIENKDVGIQTPTQPQAAEHSDGVVVYYFHGNKRCRTCNAIEKYSHEAIVPYINSGQVAWEMVNVDDPNNKHFIYDFNLASSGPAIVEYGDNEVVRWQTLDRVWQLVGNEEALEGYVAGEVAGFIKGKRDE